MVTSFVPLRCRSNYSFLHGAATIEALLEQAARQGTGALGLADLGGLYGAIQFYIKASDYSIKPIIGVELETEAGTILFIAKSMIGYGNLCRLSTIVKLEERKPTIEEIAEYNKDVIAVVFGTNSLRRQTGASPANNAHFFCRDTARRVSTENTTETSKSFHGLQSMGPELLHDIFRGDLYVGLVNLGDIKSRIRIQRNLKDIRDIKTAAANPIAFMNKDDYPLHRILRAIGEITPIDQLKDEDAEDPLAYFRSRQETLKLFSEFPGALENTLEIAEKCDLDLPIGKLNFPVYENSSNKTNSRLLYELTSEGLHHRYPKVDGEAISRLEYELNVIERAGFVDYFLIVRDIIDFCHKEGIPCVGRGSAASSIVSYCLGITEVCPIEQDLYFPRFLNEARRDPPDIDIDLCWKRRDDVLEFVYEKYGRDRVAMISTLNTFAARGAVREVAKAFGLSGDEISDFTKRLPYGGSVANIEKRIITHPECRHLPIAQEPYRSIIELAAKIESYPRHLGIHCGGIVIAPGKLLDFVPLQLSAKGIAITQYDMYSIDDLGLVKIDLLGQRGLSTIEEAKDIIGQMTGKRPTEIPDNDPETYDLLRRGKTIGVFQIESPGLRALLIAMQTKTLNDVTLALALIRPGASESGMKKVFLERFFGRLPLEYPHPLLEPVLKETMGNIIYQEQVLRVAEAMAGFTPEQGDLLRRAITKDRGHRDFALMREAFFRQAAHRGITSSVAAYVFDMMAQFAGYGFCKAHAATYALLAYRGTYLKAHHPVEYMASMLNNFAGYYVSRVYAEEARRFGAVLKTPTIDRPSDVCFVDGRDLYIGLLFVRNLSGETIERITSARKKAPFRNLFDFLARVRPSVDEAESLIRIGALDCLGKSRPQLLWLQKMYGEKRLKSPVELPMFDSATMPEPEMKFMPDLPDFDLDQKLKAEAEILEMSISCHPIERMRFNHGHVKSIELPKLEGKRVKIAGMVADRKRIKTANGKNMVFLTMEDELDMFEVTLFPDTYQRVGERIFRKPLLDIEGTVQTENGGLIVIADRVEVMG
jgi:DNA-directed DNA polymerase III PolC